jgi:RHS repeat-associated protein
VTAAPASLSGGAGTTYDTGTVTANINGTAVSAAYGQSSTPQALAAALATAITAAGAGVTATPGTAGAITVTANQAGTADNGLPVTLSSATDEPTFFSSASFSGTSGTLSGGVNGTTTPATVYNYTIGSGGASGYAANGNLVAYTDLMNGGWSLNYDNVNRVSSATATSGAWNNLTLSWTYDSFGNRKTQTPSGQNIAAPVPQAQTFSYPSQNRISNYGVNGYDVAGNVLNDQINNYLYDPEGRLCAVSYFNGMATEYMLYLYDGEGRRVAKVSNPTFSCTLASMGSTLQETYLLGPSGEHITELGQAGAFLRSNVYANGQLLATYTNNATYFALNDWLGSKRVVTKYDGTVAQMCMNLPFGDDLICSANDLSEHHFTGQLYDQESKNDYFNARYYSNNTGRFMSPDYNGTGDDPEPVPYADPANPQSLNLYAYVYNNPLRLTDGSGHGCFDNQATLTSDVSTSAGGGDVTESVFVSGGCDWSDFEPTQVQVSQLVDPARNKGQQTAPNNGIKAKVCSAIPSGRTEGASGGLGGVGSVGGGGELVFNYNSGQVSAFGFGGVQVGWNGGASGSIYTGFVYGLNSSNSNYSGGFTGFNVGDGLGIFGASSSGGLTGGTGGLAPNGAVKAGGISLGGGLLGGLAGGATATNYTNPVQLGKLWAFDPLDALLYAARQLCN